MTDPAADGARAAAVILAPDLGPRLPVEVEAALAARDSQQRPGQFFDPVSLGSLIVAIATLAWTIYNDRHKDTSEDKRKEIPAPPPADVARQVRVTLREQDRILPDGIERITEIVTTEVIRRADDA
jgi:hypothetical protein